MHVGADGDGDGDGVGDGVGVVVGDGVGGLVVSVVVWVVVWVVVGVVVMVVVSVVVLGEMLGLWVGDMVGDGVGLWLGAHGSALVMFKHLLRWHVSPEVEVDVGLSAYRSQSSDRRSYSAALQTKLSSDMQCCTPQTGMQSCKCKRQ